MADEIERAVGEAMPGIVARPVSRLRMLSEIVFEVPSKWSITKNGVPS
ncbi:MAG: hypothetical protein U9Q00_01705 [Synergistota bacterium]|nr:hypothetical protein [Synergistota bacterium]